MCAGRWGRRRPAPGSAGRLLQENAIRPWSQYSRATVPPRGPLTHVPDGREHTCLRGQGAGRRAVRTRSREIHKPTYSLGGFRSSGLVSKNCSTSSHWEIYGGSWIRAWGRDTQASSAEGKSGQDAESQDSPSRSTTPQTFRLSRSGVGPENLQF